MRSPVVLVFAEDRLLRSALEHVLGNCRPLWTLQEVGTARECMVRCEVGGIDAVIADIPSPDCPAIQALCWIKNRMPEIARIAFASRCVFDDCVVTGAALIECASSGEVLAAGVERAIFESQSALACDLLDHPERPTQRPLSLAAHLGVSSVPVAYAVQEPSRVSQIRDLPTARRIKVLA